MDLADGFGAPPLKRCYFCLPYVERRINAAPHMEVLPELAARKDSKCGVKE
jgi:hypothetical protein